MFGANYFGSPYFGQGYAGATSSGTTPSSSDTGTLTDTANQIGLNGPADSATTAEGNAIGVGSAADSGTLADGPDYRSVVLSDNPVSYWRLGESSGAVAADELGVNNGTYAASGVALGGAGAIASDTNTAATFSGTSGVSIPDSASLHFSSAMTFEVWVNPTTTGRIATKSATGGPDWFLNLETGNKFRFAVADTGFVNHFSPFSAAVALYSWHHVAGVYDGAHVRLYVDSVEQTPATAASITINNNNGALQLAETGGSLAGTIDEVAVYNTALSAARILAHYQDGVKVLVQAATSGGDAASLAEQNAIALLHSDTAAFAEQVAIAITASTNDAATLSAQTSIGVGASDTATQGDSTSSSAAAGTSDSATLTDSASVNQGGTSKSDADTATLAEQVRIALQDVDSAHLGEQLAIALAHQDTVTLGELVAVAIAISEAATLSESASTAAQVSTSDSATLTDSGSKSQTGNSPADSDSATLGETAAIAAAAADTDLATLAEQAAIRIGSSDIGTLAEQIKIGLVAADSAALVEQLAAAVTTSASDPAALGDVQTLVTAALAAAESANLAEAASVSIAGFSQTPFLIVIAQARVLTLVAQARVLTFVAKAP